jgi:hypothetical protein
MPLKLETFNSKGWRPGGNFGGTTLFKALGHPLAAQQAETLLQRLQASGPIAIYDPLRQVSDFEVLYSLDAHTVSAAFVQNIDEIGSVVAGCEARAVTELPDSSASTLLVAAFDADRLVDQIQHMIPEGMDVVTLDEMRLPQDWLSNKRKYLDPLNFATNFAFFRDTGTLHTTLRTVNYWSGYGAGSAELWLCLFDNNGKILASWNELLTCSSGAITIDSSEVRRRFGLGEFCGSLFIHALRIRGHDVVKYALDIYDNDLKTLSCTHDANAWPADLYAGMPAPNDGERVILWIQNSHPIAIPSGRIGINAMGSRDIAWLNQDIPAFGTFPLDINSLLPDLRWPGQIEVQAGRYFVRPRYEIEGPNGELRIAHANVERTDLEPNKRIPDLGTLMGKGYILPLPVLPLDKFQSISLPTPMTTAQHELPIKCALFDAGGEKVAEKYLGRIPRQDSIVIDVDSWLMESSAEFLTGYGHLELLYDFREGGEADGWLHGIGRYHRRNSDHAAETSFGAHIFNTPITYMDEPQSYAASPPGLSTRLFLRLGNDDTETMCHLIYPASLPWKDHSDTELILHDESGEVIEAIMVQIPCSGSLHWRLHETFDEQAITRAGKGAFILVRDTTCRLFGYHGLLTDDAAFCLDHMFGF